MPDFSFEEKELVGEDLHSLAKDLKNRHPEKSYREINRFLHKSLDVSV